MEKSQGPRGAQCSQEWRRGEFSDAMNYAQFIQPLTLVGLMAIMLAMGLKVNLADVLIALRKPRLLALGMVANFALVPAATLVVLYLFNATPLVAVGFLILGICPGAPIGPPFTALAKGDVACAIGQMVVLAGLSALLSPILLSVLLTFLLPEGNVHVDYLAIVRTLLVAQFLPLTIGLGIHRWAPAGSEKIAGPLGAIANLLLLAVIALIVTKEYAMLATIQLRGWLGMLLLLTISLGIGWVCGGPGRMTRKAFALTAGAHNAAVALVIVSGNFADTPAVTSVIAYALVSILGCLGIALAMGALPQEHDATTST